jgi:hypothetical protein
MGLFDDLFRKRDKGDDTEVQKVEVSIDGNSINIGDIAKITISGGVVGNLTGSTFRDFYVYEWFIIDTNHIFHVGKGQGNRYLELKGRNKYFLRIAKKYNVASRIYKDNLTEEEAWALEKLHIDELQAIGQCETNIHEGGCGGDTITRMPEVDYLKFCKKVGDKTLERNTNPEYYDA